MAAQRLAWELCGVQIAFSTIADGDQRIPDMRARWSQRIGAPCPITPRQIHGAIIANVDDADDCTLADGVVSGLAGNALGVFSADCPGLCLIAPDLLGMAHCGWRGTASGIVAALVAAMTRRSRHLPQSWRAFVGPGISGPAYEVDAPVLSAREWPADALRSAAIPGRAHLDLTRAIAGDLAAAGIRDVTRSEVCTASDERLWSYRRRGPGPVQMLIAWRSGC